MTLAARDRMRVQVPLLFVSSISWVILEVDPGGKAMPTHCSAGMGLPLLSSAPLSTLLSLNFAISTSVGWMLMLAAMMVPLLAMPIRHVRDRSFARRRIRAVALFLAGYAVTWILAGGVLEAIAMAAQIVSSGSLVPVALVVLIAFIWQVSPVKQRCLNRCHARTELAAFGRAADIDALRFGLTHGVWCVGSCWAIMLIPLLLSRGHIAAMAAVTLWLLAERLDRPRVPGWRWRGPSKAARIVVAQTRMLLQRG